MQSRIGFGMGSADAGALAIIALAWGAAILFVGPGGEFPLIDDFAYRAAVRSLVDDHRFWLHGHTAANLLSQVAWGSAFGLIFGASYAALRASTLVAGLIGGLLLYGWLRSLAVERSIALLGALTLLFNPISFVLSFTFMTDIPYMTAQTAALWLLVPRPGGRGTAIGWIMGLAALMCRQVAIAIPVARGLAVLRTSGISWKTLVMAGAPVLAFLAVQSLYSGWLDAAGLTPVMFNFNSGEIAAQLKRPLAPIARDAWLSLVYLFLYLGLMVLPVAVCLAGPLVREMTLAGRLAAAAAFGLAVMLIDRAVTQTIGLMPVWWHVIAPWGFGQELPGPAEVRTFRVWLTLASVAGGTLGLLVFGQALVRHLRRPADGPRAFSRTMGLVCAATLFAPIPWMYLRFDRHLLPMIPCLMVFVLAWPARDTRARPAAVFKGAAYAAVAAMAVFSICATRDFLSQNRMRSEALAYAATLGVPRDRIDAGWVLNGRDLFGTVGNPMNVMTWHNDPVIALDFRLREGYEPVRAFPVPRWLPGPADPLIVQRRRPDAPFVSGPEIPWWVR